MCSRNPISEREIFSTIWTASRLELEQSALCSVVCNTHHTAIRTVQTLESSNRPYASIL